MRRVLIVGVVALGAACTERVDLDLSGPKLDPNAFVGTWSVMLSPFPGCFQAFRLQFSIDSDDAALANDESMSFASRWWLPDSPSTTGVASGTINWSERTFEVVFERSDRRARFAGTNPTQTSLSGKLTELDTFLGPGMLACGATGGSATATK